MVNEESDVQQWSVRLLSRNGNYPRVPIVIETFGLLATEDGMVWGAVDRPSLDDSRGSLSWLTPDEIRFYSAVSLAEPLTHERGRPLIRFRSREAILRLSIVPSAMELYEASKQLAKELHESSLIEPPTDPPLSPIDRDYNDSARTLIDAMDPLDPLLHRGLYKFLIANDMLQHPHYMEEVGLSAFISREAALELLRRKLSLDMSQRLRKEDVINHIRTNFTTGDPFTEVLESDWAARVMMVHPVSEYGEHWSPPVEVEECFDAIHTCVSLYRYLLLDEVWDPLHQLGNS